MGKIYTKTGDKGKTGLIGGERVWKDSLQIEVCGSADELSAILGITIDFMRLSRLSHKKQKETIPFLKDIQTTLIKIGSYIATPNKNRLWISSISQQEIKNIEKHIDNLQDELPPLHKFIVPGGHPVISFLNLARSVCRRTERRMVSLSRKQSIDPILTQYFNRLSDMLFAMIRWISKQMGLKEEKPKNE